MSAEGFTEMCPDATCPNWDDHDFAEEYYGYECRKCHLFFAYGCAPWEDNEPTGGSLPDERQDKGEPA